MKRIEQLGLEKDIEFGLAQDPKTSKLMVLEGNRTKVVFGELTPLAHTHTGIDRTVHPSSVDLTELAQKNVKEHWIYSAEDGWGRLRYNAKTKTFDFVRKVGKTTVRQTIFSNPDPARPWKTSVADPKTTSELRLPQSSSGGGGEPGGGGSKPARPKPPAVELGFWAGLKILLKVAEWAGV